jgi:hypothetical protein
MRRETATRVKPVCSVAALAMVPPWVAQPRIIASLMSSICIPKRSFEDIYCISQLILLNTKFIEYRFKPRVHAAQTSTDMGV